MTLFWKFLLSFIMMILVNVILIVLFSDFNNDSKWYAACILDAIFAFVLTWSAHEEHKSRGKK